MNAVSLEHLNKSYADFHCLKDCNLQIPQGGVFGLLGPNGAGKSTLLRSLLGFLKISSGKATVMGYDVATQNIKVRENTAYLPGDPRLYRAQTGKSVLRMFSDLHPHRSLQHSLHVAKRLDLDISRRVMFMSTGMKQKLALAIVLGCQAPLVMLDEPTANLDPNVRNTVLELIREIRGEGRTVVLSSHIFSDIDDTCDRVAILRDGEIVVEQALRETANLHLVQCFSERSSVAEQLRQELTQSPYVKNWFTNGATTSAKPEAPGFSDAPGKLPYELHLSGKPSDWMHWLSGLPLMIEKIESAGVRALYKQYHSGETLEQGASAE